MRRRHHLNPSAVARVGREELVSLEDGPESVDPGRMRLLGPAGLGRPDFLELFCRDSKGQRELSTVSDAGLMDLDLALGPGDHQIEAPFLSSR